MAINLNCNLNGGDTVTPNNELFYRIYGDVDNYAVPIHTTGTAIADADVTVVSDVVDIANVDGTTNTSFKIAAVDEAGNEGILSDAYIGSSIVEFHDDFAGQILNPNNDWTVEDPVDGVALSQDDAFVGTRNGTNVTAGLDYIRYKTVLPSDWVISADLITNGVGAVVVSEVILRAKSAAGTTLVNIRFRLNLALDACDADFYVKDSSNAFIIDPATVFLGSDPRGKTFKITYISGVITAWVWDTAWSQIGTVTTSNLDSDLHGELSIGTGGNETDPCTMGNYYYCSEDFSTQYPI